MPDFRSRINESQALILIDDINSALYQSTLSLTICIDLSKTITNDNLGQLWSTK